MKKKVLLEEATATEFTIRIEAHFRLSIKTDTAIALLARKWHVDVERSGSFVTPYFTSESWKIAPHKILKPVEIADILEHLLDQPLVDLLRQAKAHPLETGYLAFNASTDPEVLRSWTLQHYKASGIDHPDSLNQIRQSRQIQYEVVNLDQIRPDPANLMFSSSEHIKAYSELMQEGVQFPPLVVSRRYHLLGGYHRYAALRKAQIAQHGIIRL
ncbi:ParB N-terminal domain-containing protein [Leptolyngbya sp. AN03gr2]|uniref:ParB N-terminal domain-containing protein n=1 Tax=unclassified Leptolyngbya TaxID=2650499 RepID=UPI003D319612